MHPSLLVVHDIMISLHGGGDDGDESVLVLGNFVAKLSQSDKHSKEKALCWYVSNCRLTLKQSRILKSTWSSFSFSKSEVDLT